MDCLVRRAKKFLRSTSLLLIKFMNETPVQKKDEG